MDAPSLEIRPAQAVDRPVLIELFLNLLIYLDQYEHDILPIRENAEWFVDETFLPAAGRGEPVLIAWQDKKAVGALFWVIQDFPFQVRWKQAMGYGTYIDPDWRRQGVGKQLRQQGLKMLKELGVEVLLGMAHVDNRGGVESTIGKGFKHYANMLHYELKDME